MQHRNGENSTLMSILIESMSVDLWNIGLKLMKPYMQEHFADKQVRCMSYCSVHPSPRRFKCIASETCLYCSKRLLNAVPAVMNILKGRRDGSAAMSVNLAAPGCTEHGAVLSVSCSIDRLIFALCLILWGFSCGHMMGMPKTRTRWKHLLKKGEEDRNANVQYESRI